MSWRSSISITAATAREARLRLTSDRGKRLLCPVPGASKATHRNSFSSRLITSRQTKDHSPVCTNSSTGPSPTSVTATVLPSTSSPKVSNGHTPNESQDGRVSGFKREKVSSPGGDLNSARAAGFICPLIGLFRQADRREKVDQI